MIEVVTDRTDVDEDDEVEYFRCESGGVSSTWRHDEFE
jgi:hypothetical protein